MRNLLKIMILAFIFRVILAFLVWHPDLNNHIDWGIRFWQYGPAKFYSANVWSFTWPNQPPGTIYMFAGIRKLYESLFAFLSFLHFDLRIFPGSFLLYLEKTLYPAMLKLPAILSDLGIAVLIYKFVLEIVDRKNLAKIGAIVWLINPVIWYNSAVWGQYDSVISFFAMLAFYLLLRKKLFFAVLTIGLSLYIKASLAIFLPIFLILALRQKYKIKEYVIAFFGLIFFVVLFSLPFLGNSNPLVWIFNLYKDKIFAQQLQIITANAFNIWAAIAGISERPQLLLLGPISYQVWGIILFTVAYIPSLWLVYKKQDFRSVVWALSISAFSSFMLLTNMHERYLYPLFPYFTILVVIQTELIANYTIVSIINLLNMYNFWWIPTIPGLIGFMSLQDRLVPRILGGVNFLLFLFLYLRFLRQFRKA